jgi:hypothetical protein
MLGDALRAHETFTEHGSSAGDKVALTRLMMQRPGGSDEEIEPQERLTRTIEQGERPRA